MRQLHDALLWERTSDGAVRCLLCPHGCRVAEGSSGICGVRKNVNGSLKAAGYGMYPAVHIDPIEKKPLNHFLPGSSVLSLGSVGCNLTCKMCQNWTLARASPGGSEPISPHAVLDMALSYDSASVAFTYNEPTVNYEFLMECAPLLRRNGIKVVLVTNGHLKVGPWAELMRHTDAANIDVKAFTQRFYSEIAGGHLAPVLENASASYRSGVHIELTYLVIPDHNDDEQELARFSEWVARELSAGIPVHFNRFHPDHRMIEVPPTPVRTLEMAREIARNAGLTNTYIGNASGKGYNDTVCPSCSALLVRRQGHSVDVKGIAGGRCSGCKREIYGVWF